MLIKTSLQLFDWLCVKGKETFLFNEECGRANLQFVLARCNIALSQFRAPVDKEEEKDKNENKFRSNTTTAKEAKEQREIEKREQAQLPLEDLAFNTKKNKQTQAQRKYDMFPFTEIGAILQNILYQLVRKDSRFLNQLLSE